jgi:hypothetical protein
LFAPSRTGKGDAATAYLQSRVNKAQFVGNILAEIARVVGTKTHAMQTGGQDVVRCTTPL